MTQEQKQVYPLQWPIGYKRTENRINSPFKIGIFKSQLVLKDEVRKLGGTDLIVSTNLRVRADGNIYSDDLQRRQPDPGVAIYFQYKGKEVTMCCDQYRMVWENICALGKGIEALRGMERWGVSEFLDRAFTGFASLPPAEKDRPHKILGISENASPEEIRGAYLNLVKIHHPDKGGNKTMFASIVSAYEQMKT